MSGNVESNQMDFAGVKKASAGRQEASAREKEDKTQDEARAAAAILMNWASARAIRRGGRRRNQRRTRKTRAKCADERHTRFS